ncbi:MAG: hypothetical protein KGZ83_20450 [Sulfuricella sp.]|nr:hypothetical protein [Sulfuricella sp.]
MKKSLLQQRWEWLHTLPDLGELCAAYPKEWETVQGELAAIFEQGKPEDLKAYLDRSVSQAAALARVSQRKHGDSKAAQAALAQYVRNRMAHLVVGKRCLAAATGVTKGKVRFNFLNGFIAQKLLFSRDLERKPVSLGWFRLLWPLLWQRKMLMPLVQPKGIYCFYSRSLVDKLAEMIGSRPCLEIAAGDGTLSRFLTERGVRIAATDNYGWKHAVQYPADVIRLDAKEALDQYAPEVVICSWPPADNGFERQVFKTASVQLYIVIGSRHQVAAGNWSDYASQTSFTQEEDRKLGSLVLPPELESAVYVFRRKPGGREVTESGGGA